MATKKTQVTLECSLCLEEFKDPRILPCIHTFCRDCLQAQIKNSTFRDKYSCPVCRATHKIPLKGVDGIQKNFYLVEMMEVNSSSKSRHRVCKEHAEEDLRFYCLRCEKPICRDCKVVRHEGHKTDMVSKIAQEKKLAAKTLFAKVELGIERLDTNLEERQVVFDREKNRADTFLKFMNTKTEKMKCMIQSILIHTVKTTKDWEAKLTDEYDYVTSRLNFVGKDLKKDKQMLRSAMEEENDGAAVSKCKSILNRRTMIDNKLELPTIPRRPFPSEAFLDEVKQKCCNLESDIESFKTEYCQRKLDEAAVADYDLKNGLDRKNSTKREHPFSRAVTDVGGALPITSEPTSKRAKYRIY